MEVFRKRGLQAGVGGIVLASGVLLTNIGQREGNVTTTYTDMAGIPTACAGVTGPGVIPGKTYTPAECKEMTAKAVEAHGRRLLACINVPINQDYYEALASWAYNIGTSAACKSTLVRKLNTGAYRLACDELLRWNQVGGKVVRGLTARRNQEHAQCVRGSLALQRGPTV